MSKVKIRHYRVKHARGFWEPTRAMKRLGFHAVPCGTDGPDAWATAEEWNQRWDRTRQREEPSPAMAAADNLSPLRLEELTVYPSRSLGEAFRRYGRTAEWYGKAPRTREDWWRCWRHIKPVFGDCNPRTVTLEDVSAWRQAIEETVSLREAHRCLKIWRALWKVSAALGYCMREADPSLGVRNRAAPGRSATWSEGEVARVAKRAWRMGYYGLAAVIAVAWDTQLSPGDVRVLKASQLSRGAAGETFFTVRGKRQGSPSAVCSATVLLRSSRHISNGLEWNCMATPTSSAIGQALPIQATRSATISATCERLNSGPASVERLGKISGAAGRSRQ